MIRLVTSEKAMFTGMLWDGELIERLSDWKTLDSCFHKKIARLFRFGNFVLCLLSDLTLALPRWLKIE